MLAGLEILNLHAQGGMAEVYRARGRGADGRTWTYAVKRLLPALHAQDDLRSMFIEEARVAALLDHPNIVKVYDLAQSDERELYLVMEFLDGCDVAALVSHYTGRGTTVPVWLAIYIAGEVLSALDYACARAADARGNLLGLIHRDVSPHNVFLCSDGQVKLTDFGVAKVVGSRVQTQAGIMKGKLGYVSPEQLEGEVLDARSDLYSVGILLYEMLTGRRLFEGRNLSELVQRTLRGEVPALDPALSVPGALEHLMRRALARPRDQRPASATAFLRELRAIAERFGLAAHRAHAAVEWARTARDVPEETATEVQSPRPLSPQLTSILAPRRAGPASPAAGAPQMQDASGSSHRKPTVVTAGGAAKPLHPGPSGKTVVSDRTGTERSVATGDEQTQPRLGARVRTRSARVVPIPPEKG